MKTRLTRCEWVGRVLWPGDVLSSLSLALGSSLVPVLLIASDCFYAGIGEMENDGTLKKKKRKKENVLKQTDL